ncbi:MAG: FGGY-family carbohydrate kinase, partial [Candidatus Fimenecus sp.]
LFAAVLKGAGAEISKPALYDMLYEAALSADENCGNLLSYNYYAGEPVTGLQDGRPLFVRAADSAFTLPNFMCSLLCSTLATLRIGMDILFEKEHLTLSKLYGHGGLYKTPKVGQRLTAAALHTPVAVMETAGEGGAWGAALLAQYMHTNTDETLEAFLENKVFAGARGQCEEPIAAEVTRFNHFLARYKAGLAIEQAAVENF